jgi:hypothetical protein
VHSDNEEEKKYCRRTLFKPRRCLQMTMLRSDCHSFFSSPSLFLEH